MISNRSRTWLVALPLLGACTAPVSDDPPAAARRPASVAATSVEGFDHDAYGRVLGAVVDYHGRVDYAALQANPVDLRTYEAALADADPAHYEQWSRTERIAFWINAYNALTMRAVIDHYPIKSSVFRSLVYPKNSIRQIPGVWDDLSFEVMGRPRTLNQIEHEILRAEFDEPRIHMALVCAAMSCPPLRWEPYTGDKLDAQLEDQTVLFLGAPDRFRVDQEAGTVFLSSIFDWFGEDFIEFYGTDERFAGREPAERAVLNFLARRLEGSQREFVDGDAFRIEYLDYDWTLNEQRGSRS